MILTLILFPDTTVSNAVKLKHVLDIYDLDQLITEPTRITLNSRSLIDLCIRNSSSKIAKCGVVQLAISDHALIFIPHKAHYQRTGPTIIKTRQMRNLHKANYYSKRHGQIMAHLTIQMRCGQRGMKGMLRESIDKHSPLKSKCVGNNKCPWITITSYAMKCVNEIS